MGALRFGVRLAVVLALGFVLTGCSNLFLFQDPNEVIVRVGDQPERYTARDVARVYAGYAQLAALAYDDVTDGNRCHLDALHERMKALKLLGASPGVVQRDTIRRLVSELRGESIGVTW